MDKSNSITGYGLSRDFFDFCFENPELISPNHIAMYFFIIEHCNRMGWKEKFRLPMEMTMEAIGIKNYKTFSKAFNDLIAWGFVKLIQKSVNQYSANIIALVKNTKATTNALGKATLQQSEKQVHDIVGIDKPITYNNKQEKGEITFSIEQCITAAMNDLRWVKVNSVTKKDLEEFNIVLEKRGIYDKTPMDYKTHYANWSAGGKKEEGTFFKQIAAPDDSAARKIIGLEK
ncbi:MAG: hypothetical protein IPP81_14620 [Chitinophagaceae bacterium]|nr:hypothetical protein [Chitinophagaceae bacterium]